LIALKAAERLWISAPHRGALGIGLIESRTLACRADLSFLSARNFPARRRAIPWEISPRKVKGHGSGARSALIVDNGRRLQARKQRLFLSVIARNRCSARDHAESRA
jgi:hypothetical protein